MANLGFHFSFSTFSLLCCLVVCPIFCHTNFTKNDELALFAFKFSVSNPFNHLTNWSNPSYICNWVGVTCDANIDRVRILNNLAYMSLMDTLPSQLGNLSSFVELDLHSNNFHGELPKELLQLHRLKILNLSSNEFDGKLPAWIGGLFALQHLIFHINSFEGVIPPSVSNLSKLETLDWTFNFIHGSIPLEIGRLQHLKILLIAKNNLSEEIPPTISGLSSPEQMSLSYNSLIRMFFSDNIR
ncbi:receptor-like protein 33 [Prosopis cineraria]|uniref:receptor-like protein 33 n=1 Tax=Prosopis cineraria TaxID=364024 RepID=UPI00240F16E4|nr:receptor-like protein 33 [Prosopis cineraria]